MLNYKRNLSDNMGFESGLPMCYPVCDRHMSKGFKKLRHLKIIERINADIAELNSSQLTGKSLLHLIKKKQNKVIKL